MNLLGELAATRAGEPLELGGPRQRAVLVVLVLARGDILRPTGSSRRERLAAIVRTEDPDGVLHHGVWTRTVG